MPESGKKNKKPDARALDDILRWQSDLTDLEIVLLEANADFALYNKDLVANPRFPKDEAAVRLAVFDRLVAGLKAQIDFYTRLGIPHERPVAFARYLEDLRWRDQKLALDKMRTLMREQRHSIPEEKPAASKGTRFKILSDIRERF